MKVNTLAVLFLTTSLTKFAFASDESIKPIFTYQPDHEVTPYRNIALDVDAMKFQLHGYTDRFFDQAFGIYAKGGYAGSHAIVKLHSVGLGFAIASGTKLSALSKGGSVVSGVTSQDHQEGDRDLYLRYESEDDCNVGGLDEPEFQGCFLEYGQLSVDGRNDTIDYMSVENYSKLTLQQFSKDASVSFRYGSDPASPYYDEFAVFADYYNHTEFADRMILAAFDRKMHNLNKRSFDFSESQDHKGRAYFIEKVSAYISVGSYMARELNVAIERCHDSKSHGLFALDAAVALYTGALQHKNGEGTSNLLFGLANHMCENFRTCGEGQNSTSGTAKVNLDVFQQFANMQQHIKEQKCFMASKNKDNIVRLMKIPFLQGLIYSAYEREHSPDDYFEEKGAVFAAAAFPRFADDCSHSKAKQLHDNFLPGMKSKAHSFEYILSELRDHYECLDVTCEEMGGLWHHAKKRYHDHAHPCRTPHESETSHGNEHEHEHQSKSEDSGAVVRVEWISAVAVLGAIIMAIAIERSFRVKKLKEEMNTTSATAPSSLCVRSSDHTSDSNGSTGTSASDDSDKTAGLDQSNQLSDDRFIV